MEDSVNENPIIVSSNEETFNVTIETNGTIKTDDGTVISKRTISVPSGTTYVVDNNTITFDCVAYDDLIVKNEDTGETENYAVKSEETEGQYDNVGVISDSGAVITVEKPADTEQYTYSDTATWSSTSGTITKDVTISATFSKTVKPVTLTIITNGTIEGTEKSKIKLDVPNGAEFVITNNTISFKNSSQYNYFIVQAPDAETEEKVSYFTVLTTDEKEREYFTSLGTIINDISVIKPEDYDVIKYEKTSSWYLGEEIISSGTITKDTTLEAIFDTTANYEVIIKTNGKERTINVPIKNNLRETKVDIEKSETDPGTIVDIDTTRANYWAESITYTTSGCTITFSNGQEVTVTKPDNTEYAIYTDEPIWTPESGTITGSLIIEAYFPNTLANYDITITTNGSISGEEEGTKTKTVQIPYGETYQVNDNTITFSGGTIVTVVKPEDDYKKALSGKTASWSTTTGSIYQNLDISANFTITSIYNVDIQKDADGEKIEVNNIYVLNNTTYSTDYVEVGETNTITFVGKIYIFTYEPDPEDPEKEIEVMSEYSSFTIYIDKPDDDIRHKYYNKANWYNSNGITNTINNDTVLTALFNFLYSYNITVITNKIIDNETVLVSTDERYVYSGTIYSVENDTVKFTYNGEEIGSIVATTPDKEKKWEYLEAPKWDSYFGIVEKDITLNANFAGTLVNYNVSITTNGTISDGTEQSISFEAPYGTKYSKEDNTITFVNSIFNVIIPGGKENPSERGWYEKLEGNYVLSTDTTIDSSKTYYIKTDNTIKEVIVVKPEDDDEHRYKKTTTWSPESGEVTDIEETRNIVSTFNFTSKYEIHVTTNGTIKDTTTSDKSLIIISGTTYKTDGNIITFTYNDTEEEYEQVDVVEIVKPKDTIQIAYNETATWNPSSGTVEGVIIIEGNFESSPQYYDVDVKTNGTFETGYHEIILSLPYGTEYQTYAKTSGEVTENSIEFSYDGKVIESHVLDRPDSSYTYNVTWEPVDKNGHGAIIGDTEETIIKNITGNFALKNANEGEVVIFDKYTIDEGYVKMDDEGKIVINDETMPYGYKARIMKLYVALFYVGDEEEQKEKEHFLVRWKLSVCDRLYTYTTYEEEGKVKRTYTYVDSMSEDGDWYTTGPTIVKIDGIQRWFHVETGTTQGELEGLNAFPSIPGYIEGEFYKYGDENDVCDPIEFSLITFIGDYTKTERDSITTQILLGNPTYNYRDGSLEIYYPSGFTKERTITLQSGDEYIDKVEFVDSSIEGTTHTFDYSDSTIIEATLKDDTHLFSYWKDSNENIYYDNPLTIDKIKDDLTYTAYSTEVYGVQKSISDDNSIWERTNASVGLIAEATHDGSEVTNDFDNIYPWSDIITVNIKDDTVVAKYGEEGFKFDGTNGDVMTYIPKHYIRRYLEDGNEHIQISKNTFIGATEIEPFYISRYPMSEDYMSKSNSMGQVNQTMAEFRESISTNKGDKWSQLDWRLFVILNLYSVEYATGESQETLGYGISKTPAWIINSPDFKHFEQWEGWDEKHTTLLPYNYKKITYKAMSGVEVTHIVRIPPDAKSYQVANGECDNLGMHSGCLANDGLSSVIYRGIENPFGNIWCFVDGINIKSFKIFVCTNHAKYKNNYYRTPYKRLDYIASYGEGSPTDNGYDSSYPLIAIPTSTTSSKTDGYHWRERGERILISGGHWYNNTLGEIFTLSANYTPRVSRFDIGTRLMCDEIEVKEDEE